MTSAFRFYDSISYSDNCKGVNKLNKKKTQAVKVVEITTHESYVENKVKQNTNNFFFRVCIFFFSGMVASIIDNIYRFYFKKFMKRMGFDDKSINIEIEV